jgi:hypothetical protein
MTKVMIGSDDGLREVGLDGAAGSVAFEGRTVTALGAEYPDLWAIVESTEVWRTSDGGWEQRGSAPEGTRLNCIADVRAGYLVGTSEAHLLRVGDHGLEPVDAFEDAAGRDDWYTPWGGPPDVRSISEDSDVVLVNVHVGGIVRTLDEGATWEPTIDIHSDVHRVTARDGRAYAACARGLAVSEDRGDSWSYWTDGLHATYCRGVALCGDTVLVSASRGPRGGQAAVYRAPKDGGAFERCTAGLPEWFDSNIDSLCLDAIPDHGVAAFGTDDGRVFVSRDEGTSWEEIASGPGEVRSVLLMP